MSSSRACGTGSRRTGRRRPTRLPAWRRRASTWASSRDEIGDKQDALRAYEESLAIRERLARENPSVTQFQSDLAASHNNIGSLAASDGPAGGGAGVVRAGPRDPGAAGEREPVGHRVPARAGRESQQHRASCRLRRVGRRRRLASYEQARRSRSGWRETTRRSPSSRATWPESTSTSASCTLERVGRRRRWRRTSRPARSRSGWRARTRRSPSSRADLAGSHYNIGGLQSSTVGRRRRATSTSRPARSGSGWRERTRRSPIPERSGPESQRHRRNAA